MALMIASYRMIKILKEDDANERSGSGTRGLAGLCKTGLRGSE